MLTSTILYLFITLPVISARVFYLDDNRRALLGDLNWGINGRPLTDLLMTWLSFGTPILDAFPLWQILAGLILTLGSALLFKRFEIPGGCEAAAIGLSLGGNPLFLQNLSFRFDAFSMAVSVVLAIIPCIMPIDRIKLSVSLGGLALLAALCLYQPSINVFLVLAVTEVALVRGGLRPERLKTLLATRTAQLGLSLLFYAFVAKATLHGSYAEAHHLMSFSACPTALLGQILSLANNGYGSLLTSRFRWAFLLLIASALGVIILTGARQSMRRYTNGKRWFSLCVSIVFIPALWLCASFALLVPILPTSDAPRMFVGIGAVLSSALLILRSISTGRSARVLFLAVLLLAVYTQIFVAMTYGNALAAQTEYEQSISQELRQDVQRLVKTERLDQMIVEGNVGYAPLVSRAGNHGFKLIFKLVPVQLVSDEAGFFTIGRLQHFGIRLRPVNSESVRRMLVSRAETKEPLVSKPFYTIYIVDSTLFVQFTHPI